MSGISLSLSSQSSVFYSPASPFSLLLSKTHTHTPTGVLPMCVFPDHKPTASSPPAALQAFCHPLLLKHKMSFSSGMQIRTCSFIPRSCWPLPCLCLSLSRPRRAEDEDLGSEAAVGSLTGHQQSTHQITEHVQVGTHIFIVLQFREKALMEQRSSSSMFYITQNALEVTESSKNLALGSRMWWEQWRICAWRFILLRMEFGVQLSVMFIGVAIWPPAAADKTGLL